jgi:hypothetical protein
MQWRGSSAQLSMGTLSNESCHIMPPHLDLWHHAIATISSLPAMPHHWIHSWARPALCSGSKGHVHDAVDYVIGSTRVVANSRGYPGETGRESGPFRWDFIAELPA